MSQDTLSLTTGVSYEDYRFMDRVVVLPVYLQRLVPEIGVNGVWVYAAHCQAFFMAGVGSKESSAERRVGVDEIVKWGVLPKRTYERNIKKLWPKMRGLLERKDNNIKTELYRREGKTLRRRLPHEHRLYLTPRLAQVDAAFIYQFLYQSTSVEAGIKKLNRTPRKDLMKLFPPLGAKAEAVEGLENMHFVLDIVHALMGEGGEVPEALGELARKLHLKIIKLWGKMFLSHYFLYKLVPEHNLSARQAWFIAVARSRAYINSQTGEMRSEINFSGGYEEIAKICGMASWKGIGAWLRSYKRKKGGDLSLFIREINSPDDKLYDEIGKMARHFFVQLDDEGLTLLRESNGVFGESNDTFPEESNGIFGESSGTLLEESNGMFGNSAPLKVLKTNTINTEKVPPPKTLSTQKSQKVGGGEKSFSTKAKARLSMLRKLNHASSRKPVNPDALVSWLLYAYSLDGEGIRNPFAFAMSQLKADPHQFASGFEQLAKLDQDALFERFKKYLQFEESEKGLGWKKFVHGMKRERLIELAGRLFDVDPEEFEFRIEYVAVTDCHSDVSAEEKPASSRKSSKSKLPISDEKAMKTQETLEQERRITFFEGRRK